MMLPRLLLRQRQSTLLRRAKVANARTLTTVEDASKPIRWGIVGAGSISKDFAKAVNFTQGAEISAVAARSASKAAEFAKNHDIPQSYGSYDDLIQDPNVDVVYIGTIADTHAPLAKMSLLHHKPTVVEKPLTTSFQETKELIDLAKRNQVFFLEGMWSRFFPAMKKVRQLIADGAIGQPVMVSGDFGWSTQGCDEHHRIWFPASGGMIYDVAMYMAQLGLAAYEGDSFYKVSAMGITQQPTTMQHHPVDHTALVSCQMEHNRNGFLQFHVTGQASTEERAVFQGTKGRIVLENHHVPSKIQLYNNDGAQILEFPLPDDSFASWDHASSIGFTYQIEGVGKALREGALECPEFTWRESLEIARMLEDIRGQVIGTAEDEGESSEPESETASVARYGR
ncbi:Trans-1,2-dihydrobenzene-1,2-diol dehydrogenase [Seminavis robusta]|uniref:D-xylose 1-dehydrogenase (NADP(+), D-xylono-1,5-lactone-forming) n=1 Tax=Seminavis robusta TaxID=568900 RepID=A0A9N8DE82_9STRA|nr:Trans-1,2-dihydrobenzene-1,2-diol dehydrogenase [Seminavis robusta]|eukprot:Sro98_g050630.1 Trans-1,2-dihydrobenzene-1,2-diol dehydrogenase (397) ;mRNA; r:105876-107326